ncbi:MAG TPA: UGSC family (seleno)protein [Candidatus Baltobacteraceae bacterium]|nr:UGSC family (seleno)protein [Candidatus Baltobacteraceae bacterium]
MGIPAVPMVTIAFKDLAKTNAAKRGMPLQRIVFTPHPVWGKTDEEMYAYLEGNDPVSGKPLMPEVIADLTRPLTADESKSGVVTPPTGAPSYTDTSDNLQQYYLDNGMTDFMPIILPTQEKVDAMLKGTSHAPDEVVGKMTPAQGAFPAWSFTVQQVAVNAVMAGATPDYFPTLLAIGSTGISALFSSTNSLVSAAVINGPIRDKLQMNYGIGAMGPFNQANAVIGRAWTLMSKNLDGGGIAGETYMGSQGNVINYNNLIIPENEKDSPWPPFHVQKGFKPTDNVVSFFFGFCITQGQGGRGLGVKPIPLYHEAMSYNAGPFASLFGAMYLLDPLVANGLVELGYKTKDQLADWLQKNTTISVKDVKSMLFSGLPRGPEAANLTDDSIVPKWQRPDAFNFIVIGGQTNPYHQLANMSYRVSSSIDKWT